MAAPVSPFAAYAVVKARQAAIGWQSRSSTAFAHGSLTMRSTGEQDLVAYHAL